MDTPGQSNAIQPFIAGITMLIETFSSRPEAEDGDFVRFPLRNCFATLTLLHEEGHEPMEVKVRDIGFRGLGLLTPAALTAGTRILIVIKDADSTKFVGTVVRCLPDRESYIVGVQLHQPGKGPVGIGENF